MLINDQPATLTPSLTDRQWAKLTAHHEEWANDDLTPEDFTVSLIEDLLSHARDTLSSQDDDCLPCPELTQLVFHDTSDSYADDFILHVELPGWPTMSTTTLGIKTFRANIELFGSPPARAVLNQLLYQRALLLHQLNTKINEELTRRGTRTQVVHGVRIDAAARRAWMEDKELNLSIKEFDLLRVLIRDAGKVVTREQIMREVWDTDWWSSTKTLDMHMSFLRRKLGDDAANPRYITTVRGVGFRFERE
ncbi:winged helix-turn-helix domain-containing protein [Nonomuraea jabiensis]|uniref:winged helix-turn-helix domain-containing protein n=1 Tax=Nonomuraea jabiensis TaxID=882448 RepID=UPI003D756B99